MHLTTAFASLLLTLKVQAILARSHNTINWFHCEQNGSVPITCGTLTVPLDYTDLTSNKTLNLDLVKFSALKQPKKGSILFNPGGPGQGGREFVAGFEKELLMATGGSFDLIGFDPRGTGNTIPFSCYSKALTQEVDERGLRTYLMGETVQATWDQKTIFAKHCYKRNKDTGRLIGTAFVARDMMQIVDALDEDGLLRYWGISYGTVLGATVAAMFPDRMDKIVLDGVVNLQQYYAGEDFQGIVDTDATFSGFFASCVADPENCALAQDGITAQKLQQKVYDLIYKPENPPTVAEDYLFSQYIDETIIKFVIRVTLRNTFLWPDMATALHQLLKGNPTHFLSYYAFLSSNVFPSSNAFPSSKRSIYPNHGPEAYWGIHCSDASIRTKKLTDLYPLLEELNATCKVCGDAPWVDPVTCAQWLFKAAERYEGDFKVRTRRPVLFVGNTHDPVTPLVSARNVSDGFEGSVVLQHDGYGHSSISQPSLCTAKAISAYFENGTLPALGTVCGPSAGPFSNETPLEAWAPIVNFTKRVAVDRDENDDALLSAWMKMSKKGLRGDGLLMSL